MIEGLREQLSTELGHVVQDKTGLTGNYDFNLRWAPDSARTPVLASAEGEQRGSDTAATSESYGPSLFTALEEQLGLKLESQKGSVEILVIDHVEMPTENQRHHARNFTRRQRR
jgi:uncharacterized protein (TIGR03435 family)